MPGRMGHENVTMQNLEIVAVDTTKNVVLIKGSIPGPNKSFVVIKSAVKKDKVDQVIELLDVNLEHQKNELLEEAKKVGAKVTTSMAIAEMKELIAEATIQHEANLKEQAELLEKAKGLGISKADKLKLDELRNTVAKAEEIEASRANAKEEPTTEEKVDIEDDLQDSSNDGNDDHISSNDKENNKTVENETAKEDEVKEGGEA